MGINGANTFFNQLFILGYRSTNNYGLNDVLAFSIGGLIAWKAQLMGLKTNNLYSVSSTRLRYKMKKPNGNLYIYHGERDLFKPEPIWFNSFELVPKIFSDKEHELYSDSDCIDEICRDIRKK